MKVISVVNNKGGVGKTTVTANLGAGLAARGHKVLMIDLDPQASLTFSFFSEEEWGRSLQDRKTIKQWYDAGTGRGGKPSSSLADLIATPPRAIDRVAPNGGWLDLIASHLDLVNTDVMLRDALDPKTGEVPPARYLRVYRRLAEGLQDPAFSKYDYVLIDCAPSFTMMTKNAVIASDHLVVPTRPDFLSTRGINFLGRTLGMLVQEYNGHARSARTRVPVAPLSMPNAAVLFTMVQYFNNEPLADLRVYISRVKALRVPTFDTMLRLRNAVFAAAPEFGVPVVLGGAAANGAAQELTDLVEEFVHWIGRTHP